MRKYVSDILLVLVCLCVVLSCSREREVPPRVEVEETPAVSESPVQVVTEMEPAVSEKVAERPAQQHAALPTQESLPFRVCAIIVKGDGIPRIGLIDKATGDGMMLREGDELGGYKILNVDPVREQVIFDKDGSRCIVSITGAPDSGVPASGSQTAAGTGTTRPADDNFLGDESGVYKEVSIDILSMPREEYEPTPEEVSAGIDPNNPDTWTENYKGPGLERLLKEHPQTNQVNPVLEYIRNNPVHPED